ncbi:phBC6A51 family helix-turn-helix protein [Gottfriedia acidiceleris]|uniref:phBC6A51 family helix-turn-helix protein n=1 Tax=Gottfriedia acidiceleris TaxID=371036 RepID=UPI002F263D88
MLEQKQIPLPSGLSTEQVNLAKAFVKERHQSGISINDFVTKHGKSTKTWYEWIKDEVFSSYLNALGGTIISEDERSSYQVVKRKIMSNATKASATVKDIELYLKTFSYIVDSERIERMIELGISPAHEKIGETRSVEEKKASLLARLTAKPNTTKGDVTE